MGGLVGRKIEKKGARPADEESDGWVQGRIAERSIGEPSPKS